jgi:hypothetical protein
MKNHNTTHKQAKVYNPLINKIIKVDQDIAELLTLLWKLELFTYNSCQFQEETPEVIWIEFDAIAAERFFTIIAQNRDAELENPEASLYCRMREFGWENDWTYDVLLNDVAEKVARDRDEIYYEGTSDIHISISVRFPSSDYDKILNRLKENLT